MKRKLILILVCAGFGLWLTLTPSLGVRNWLLGKTWNPSRAGIVSAGGAWGKRLKSPWLNSRVVLYRANGEVVQLDAWEAIYTVWPIKSMTYPRNQDKPLDIAVAAFIDPATKAVWFGEVDIGQITGEGAGRPVHTNLFIETGPEIIRAGNVMFDGIFDWDESMAKQLPPGAGLDALINGVENTNDVSWPFTHTHWEIDVSPYFRENFFRQDGVMHGEQEIKHIEMSGGTLWLNFPSSDGKSAGKVQVDLKTSKVLKTIETKTN